MTVFEFLDRLESVSGSLEAGWSARCPAHEDERNSLSIGVGLDGRILIRCHAGEGCAMEAIVDALGLRPADLFPDGTGPSNIVAAYDYVDKDGALLYQVVRFEPKEFRQRRPDGEGGWVWNTKGARRVLFRLPQVLEAIAARRTVYVVEGEKDVIALQEAGAVATCNAMGAGKWRAPYAKVLAGANVVVVQDRDAEGRKHASAVARSLEGAAASVRLVEPAEGNDVSDHLAAGRTLDQLVPVLRPRSQSSRQPETPESPGSPGSPRKPHKEASKASGGQTGIAPESPPKLAFEPDILGRFRTDLRLAGVAGEELLAQILYLALTSRVFPWGKPTERPVSVIPKGTTSTGKSHTTMGVLRFFPERAYIHLGSMSRRFLFYDEDEYAHRMIYVPEWATIAEDEEIVATLRILLSEGRIVHGTVVGGGAHSRRIEKDGPCGLIVTTTATAVDAELETRCLSVTTDDSVEQTRRVYEVLADLEDEVEPLVDYEPWLDFQSWIGAGAGTTRVAVPFVRALSKLVPTGATRLRRDFVTLVCLIRAHAVLYQAQRERDQQGRVLATVEGDYAPVAELVEKLIAEGAEVAVSEKVRETVEAVRSLKEGGAGSVTANAVSKVLGVGMSAAYDRIRRALAGGYLVDESLRSENGRRLSLGTPLPGEGGFLPTPAAVAGFRVDSGLVTGDGTPHGHSDSGLIPAIPVVPVTSTENHGPQAACAPSAGPSAPGPIAVDEPAPVVDGGQTISIGDGPPLEVVRAAPGDVGELVTFLNGALESGLPLGLDLEASCADPHAPDFVVRAWSVSDGVRAFVTDHADERARRLVAELISRHPHPLVFHNGFGFDLAVVVRELGVDVDSITRRARERAADRRLDDLLPTRPSRPASDRPQGDGRDAVRRRRH